MNKIIMLTNEFSPYTSGGGLGVAIMRLVEQLKKTSDLYVFFPQEGLVNEESLHADGFNLKPIMVQTRQFKSEKDMAKAMTFFCKKSLSISKKYVRLNDSILIAHDNEVALSLLMDKDKEAQAINKIFWMHSLYDHPQKKDFPTSVKKFFSHNSIMASAIDVSGHVIISNGVLDDALQIEWPKRLAEVQVAIQKANIEKRIMVVESTGCMPMFKNTYDCKSILTKYNCLEKPYVLFPSRPSMSKGFSFFVHIAKKLSHLKVDFISVGEPNEFLSKRGDNIRWVPWLSQEELSVLMRGALCVTLPSITEQYGLAAVESICSGSNTIYHNIGGLRALNSYDNAVPISLSYLDLFNLYSFWGDILDLTGNLWPVWDKYEPRFSRLLEQWTQVIESKINKEKFNNKPPIITTGGMPWGKIIETTIQEKRIF
jgi:glycosyltransferase involved in cell wall biosynthesis